MNQDMQIILKTRFARGALVIAATAALLLVGLTATASAEITLEGSIGAAGEGAGQLKRPGALAINQATGDIYAVDTENNRVEQFSESGQFIRTWGFDVVASGPDNVTPNEVQQITVGADSGSYRLTYQINGQLGTKMSSVLPYNATAAEVEAAINAPGFLPEAGSSVSVSGTSPYKITFDGGPIAHTNAPELELVESDLGLPEGSQLTCEAEEFAQEAPTKPFEYQWLANGQPISGATAPTYVTTAVDGGKVIQCEVIATFFKARTYAIPQDGRNNQVSFIASPAIGLPPKIEEGEPFLRANANETLRAGGPGGAVLTCHAGHWAYNPTFTYQWYRNGAPIGTPTTTTEATNTYVVQEADLAELGGFQCQVSATNANGTVTYFTAYADTHIEPQTRPIPRAPRIRVEAPLLARVITSTTGGAGFEICQAGVDVCKAGAPGVEGVPAIGQLSFRGGLEAAAPPAGIAVDNSPLGAGAVYVVDPGNGRVQKFTAAGTPLLTFGGHVNLSTGENVCTVASGDVCGAGDRGEAETAFDYSPGVFGGWEGVERALGDEVAVDDTGNVYVGDMHSTLETALPRVQKFNPDGNYLGQVGIAQQIPSPSFYSQPVSVEADTQGHVFVALGDDASPGVERFDAGQFAVEPGVAQFSERISFDDGTRPKQLAVDPSTQFLWVSDQNKTSLGEPLQVCGESGETRSALLAFDAEGHRLECATPTGPAELREVTGLAIGPSGHAFVSTGGENKIRIYGLPQAEPPQVISQSAVEITAESARLKAQVHPHFKAEYTFEYGLEDCATSTCTKAPTGQAYGNFPVVVGSTAVGLAPHTRYHYRVVLHNDKGTVVGPDQTFATFAEIDTLHDPCPNALARKQTRSAELFDCRAYELASAESTGGYDVESDLIPGQAPFALSGGVDGKVLYGVHDGGIPGTGNPTNRGLDPYVAVRNEAAKRWETKYVGIPANGGFSAQPFSSTLAEADRQLGTFAFSGDEICSPCFADGSTGLPVHLANGTLVQGMKGSEPAVGAEPAGYVGRYLSNDGAKLVFGTTSRLEPTANEGEVTLYERDLSAGTTEVISTRADGSTMDGVEVGELDMSGDGSRVLVGEEISTDGAGNTYWHPYMHFAGTADSSDLAPGATAGVLFDGMTADGSKVFYTTTDKLLPADTDNSADIYEAEVSSGGGVTLRLVSVGAGGPVNSDACGPNSWNASAGDGKCGALAIAGGAGVASESGTIYFLSPELLDGASGTADQPNLYVERQGDAPQFVATLEQDNPLVEDATQESSIRRWGDFDVSPNGNFAAFATTEPLDAEYDNQGFSEVYRYDAPGERLDCTSCAPTEAPAGSDASLPAHGLGLTDDGRVFFNTADPLVLRDSNQNLDGYEWEDGVPRLISTGTSIFDSGMLGVTADGRDAFFFTRDKLVATDFNGEAMKLYDAREEGGFFEIPHSPPCAASDECHGPSSQAPAPPQIGTFHGTGGQHRAAATNCKKGFVKKHGKCVRKRHHKKNRHGHKRTAKKTRGAQR